MRKAVGPKPSGKAVQTARGQRRTMSLPEVLLWSALRKRPGDLKFRRQHPLGAELAIDFYCNDARLAIEVDGEAHDRGDRPDRDARRDAILRQHGIETLRIPAREILHDLDAVLTGILAIASMGLPLHHAAHGPPPRDKLGED
ncbi:very-short-patch-repair endonuclease [Sphingomonas jinjuensis]|uniref:Very-short-patch-repair endonuclease n=1 Tax=Sphingomonas jinjuensis TaxID=535907 RepID=A0A840F9L3_9SPHN|nr:DUF559 domain-containing protein [Sphingomonas jinjuensis]MBB4153291.1 very-short-patch-repair endonuclease [Sphingomonas jinjuensis]